MTPSMALRSRRKATWFSIASGLTLLGLILFSLFLLLKEQGSRTEAWEVERSNEALSMANRLIQFSLALDHTVLLRSENPSLMELTNLANAVIEIEADLGSLIATRPDVSRESVTRLRDDVEQLNQLAIQRSDLLALRNNLEIAVRENATVYQDDPTPSELIASLREAIAAESLILIGEISRRFSLDLRNAQINAALASRFRQLAYGSRGVFPVSEDLILVNEDINQIVQRTQRQLDSLIDRLQSQPNLVNADLGPTSGIGDWRSQLIAVLILLVAISTALLIKHWRRFLNNAHQVNRLDSLGHISGHVAHDISNMISVTISSLNILKEHPDPSDKRLRTTLDKALFAADKSVSTIDRLLTFARRNRLSPELCSVNELIEGLFEVVQLTVGDDVEVTLELCEKSSLVMVDPGQLESALINLCINARNAMAENGHIIIRTEVRQRHFLSISVIDNGRGIPRQILPRVFEPFFTTDKSGGGLGLGLSTIYGFVKQSGGDIHIASTVGKGTRVTMSFEQ